MDEKIQLTKVNIIGRKWFNSFKMDDGSVQKIETTEQDYKQLGTKTPINPTTEGGVWLYSYERYRFDTLDGDLSDGQYCDNGNDYLLKSGTHFVQVNKDKLINNEIDKTTLDGAVAKMVELEKGIAI